MRYFPLFADTKNLNVLVVGGGDVAARKLALLTRTQASITVVALSACDEVERLAADELICLKKKPAEISDLDAVQVLYMATADAEVNRKFAVIAERSNIWVNVVDSPDECAFITPAIVDRGKLQIAISSGGAAPVVAGLIRTKIESWLPQSVTELIDFSSSSRKLLKQKLPCDFSFRQFWYRFFKLNGFGYDENTQVLFDDLLTQTEPDFKSNVPRKIYFINSDKNISRLPVSALPILQQIDTVIYEDEVPAELNELIRRDAARIKINTDTASVQKSAGLTLLIAKKHDCENVIELS